MSKYLRVLLVEDSADDALLILRELSLGEYVIDHMRVQSQAEMITALSQTWDIVLSDYSLPGFSGSLALSLLRKHDLTTPFIFISGSIGEDTAVGAMKAGAQDYIMKSNLKRLLPAVERECNEARYRMQQQQQEENRKELEARYRSVLTLAPDAVIALDEQFNIIVFNQGAENIFEYSAEDILNMPFSLVLPESSHQNFFNHLHALKHSIENVENHHDCIELCGLKKSGSEFPAEANISKFIEDNRTTFTVILRDITERKSVESRLNYLAHYDGLTGLPNRMLFSDRLQQCIYEAARQNGIVGVALLDLDRFKTINDSLGHGTGDLLLKVVSARLKDCIREEDTVARLGGDEFTLLLPVIKDASDAARLAKRLLESFRTPFNIAGRELYVTASFGIAFYPVDGHNIDELIRSADLAMYRAKDGGGNGYEFHTSDMTKKAQHRLLLESDLREAIEQQKFILHYQPVINLKNKQTSGVEALIRWDHDKRGIVMPDDFISIAEETGFIHQIGNWALRSACNYAATQNAQMLTNKLRVAVNVSARQFQESSFAEKVQTILEETKFDPKQLDLEITESFLMQNPDGALKAMRSLGDMGVRFSVDDFGTGYSSLNYLKHLPISKVKIDQSFVHDVPHDPHDCAIIAAIISMAHTLGLEVVAEGVETQEQLDFLSHLQCDEAQGYFFSKPHSADSFRSWLQNYIVNPMKLHSQYVLTPL